MNTPLFTGMCTALVTPFDQGRIDGKALRRLMSYNNRHRP